MLNLGGELVQQRTVPTLSNLTPEFLSLLHMLDAVTENGEVLEDGDPLLARLAEVEQQITKKVDGYIGLIREVGSYAETCKAEAARLSQRAARWAKQEEWLRGRVHQAMVAMDLQVIQSATNTVKRVKNGGLVPLELLDAVKKDPTQAGEEFVVWEQVPSLDKEKVRRCLESGTPEEKAAAERFARLGVRGERLRFS